MGPGFTARRVFDIFIDLVLLGIQFCLVISKISKTRRAYYLQAMLRFESYTSVGFTTNFGHKKTPTDVTIPQNRAPFDGPHII